MNVLVAKTIIKDQYWVVTDGEKKVGNVYADNNGYEVKLNGTTLHFTNETDVKNKTQIIFEPLKSDNTPVQLPYPQYPVPNKTYNSVFDIKRKLHLFTKSNKSKCYHVAGYFVMNQNGNPEVVYCPKYLYVQRYPYKGPYKSYDEAYGNK
jgi:hypothetical protein